MADNQQIGQLNQLEWISNMSWDSLLNYALLQIVGEHDLSAERLQMRVRTLQALMADELEKERGKEGGYYELCEKWHEEVENTSKENRYIARVRAEYKKLDELVKKLRGKVPVQMTGIMATLDEIEKTYRNKKDGL